jgi:hypothetical protein
VSSPSRYADLTPRVTAHPDPRRWARLSAAAIAAPALGLVAYYEWSAHSVAGAFGFPLDDSWIHAQFARNLATLRGFTYTTDHWVAGSTAPLWTVALAFAYAVIRDVVVAGKLLGVLFQLLAGFAAARLALVMGLPRWPATVAGMATAALPIMVWGAGSGMEVSLAAALVVAGLVRVLRPADQGSPYAGYVLLGLAALARPESIVIGGLTALFELAQPMRWGARLRRMVVGGLIVTSIFALLVAFSVVTIGRPLPTTFYAKSGPGIVRAIEAGDGAMLQRSLAVSGPAAVKNYWWTLQDQLGFAAWAVPVGLLALLTKRERRRAAIMLATILVVTPFMMGITAPQRLKPDNVRYVAQLVAPAVVFAAAAMAWLPRSGVAGALVGLLVGLSVVSRSVDLAGAYAVSVKNIQQLHVTAGLWMREHLPADAVVAVNDVGAIAYFSERRILDLEGLVSPEVLPYRGHADRGLRVVTDFRPDFIAIFPHWYPDLAQREDLFQEIHRVRITDNLISAGDTLVIYRTPWTREVPH